MEAISEGELICRKTEAIFRGQAFAADPHLSLIVV